MNFKVKFHHQPKKMGKMGNKMGNFKVTYFI